jgi:hypothetical protein
VRRWLRGALCAGALLGTMLAGTACSGGRAGAGPAKLVAPSPTRVPAALAGGACQLLDFDVIEAQLGVSFGLAAAATSDATYTCVVQPAAADLPDLSLAVTPTKADATVFKNSVQPKGGAAVGSLGKIAYSVSVPAGGGAGQGIEVTWLSANQRLISLRYRSPNGTAAGDVSALLPKLVGLAKVIDLTNV